MRPGRRRLSVSWAESLKAFSNSGVIGSGGALAARVVRTIGASLAASAGNAVTTDVVRSVANTSVRLVGLAALVAT